MRYAVNTEGISALKALSNRLQENVVSISSAADMLESALSENGHGLGPHRASIERLISEARQAHQDACAPVLELSENVLALAKDYQDFMDVDRFGSGSGAGSEAQASGIAVGAETHTQAGNSQINTDILGQLGSDFISHMNGVLATSKHPDVQSVYREYGNRLVVKHANHEGGAFYRHGEGVYMNSTQVANGDMIHTPYQTAFHEFGHNIDYIMGDGEPISESWGNNALYDAIKGDFEALKGEQTNEQLIDSIKEQMKENGWSIMDVASVSDIIESMTGISYPLGVGHGSDYWSRRLPNKEFFAETLDGAAANERSYGLLREMFPNAVSVVHTIIGGEN